MGAVNVATPIQRHDCVESRRHDSRADWVAPGFVAVARLRLRLEHVREQVREPCHGEDAAREAVAQGEGAQDPSLGRGAAEDEGQQDEDDGLPKQSQRVQGLTGTEVILTHSSGETAGFDAGGR